MKKTMVGMVLMVGCVMVQTGCVSAWNHGRINNNRYSSAIMSHGSEHQKNLLMMGVAPADVVRFSVEPDGAGGPLGVLRFDVSNMSGLRAYLRNYMDNPVSSTISLVADAGLGYGLYLVGDAVVDSTSSKDRKSEVNVNVDGTQHRVVVVTGDNPTTTSSQSSSSGK